MRTQWTAKGNRDAGPSCSSDRGLHRYLRNFGGGGVWTPPLGTPLAVGECSSGYSLTPQPVRSSISRHANFASTRITHPSVLHR